MCGTGRFDGMDIDANATMLSAAMASARRRVNGCIVVFRGKWYLFFGWSDDVMYLELLSSVVSCVLVVNGVYDVTCALSILFFSNVPVIGFFSRLHPTMFVRRDDSNNVIICHLIAYWLLSYGSVRFVAGLFCDLKLDLLAALSYFIEAFCFEYEYLADDSLVYSKVEFVSASSVLLGVLVLLRQMLLLY